MPSVSVQLPHGFTPQTSDLSQYATLIERPVAEILAHFQAHPREADAVLNASYDKRYTPSSFVEERGETFQVGWYKDHAEALQGFGTLAEAVTDYLLLSFGKGRLVADRPAI